MKKGKVDIKKTIKKRIALRQTPPKKRIVLRQILIKKNEIENQIKMGVRDKLRTTGTPPISVDLIKKDEMSLEHNLKRQGKEHIKHEFFNVKIINNKLYNADKIHSIDLPLINILIRTSGRPNYFMNSINSILSQTYKNYNIIVGIDDENSLKYVSKYDCLIIKYDLNIKIETKLNDINYGKPFKYNLYLNELQKYVKDGYILYIDDDDKFNNNDALSLISEKIKKGYDLIMYRALFPNNRIIPSNENFFNKPVVSDISGICFCFNSKIKPQWEAYKRGDFRVATYLCKNLEKIIHINKPLTTIQRKSGDGYGRRDDMTSPIKKTVNTFNPEFGYELIAAVPYAYYLYMNNQLDKTVSAKLSEPLYYFSPNHEINPKLRSWDNTVKFIQESGIPNAAIHKPALDLSQFTPPPYKKHFANTIYVWEKPTICICNRYNYEWGKPPINYFSIEILEELFNLLKEKYQIIYYGVDILDEMQDTAHSLHLGDVELCNKHKEVILFQNLLNKSNLTWNELSMKVFANCDNFITMNGGYSILASYFGGTNIIYSKECREVEAEDAFNNWYHLFGNSKIIVTRTYDTLITEINKIL